MTLEFYIDHKHKVIMQLFKGDISIASITHTIPHIWQHPDYSPSYNSIIDFRNSKLQFSKAELNDLLIKLEEAEEAKKNLQGNLALIVSEPTSAASAALFVEQSKDGHAVGIFCSESEVIRFLKSSPEIFEKADDIEVVTIHLP